MNIVPTDVLASVDLDIPCPPSVNEMYANSKNWKGRGRYKTERYRIWQRAAEWDVKAAVRRTPVQGWSVVCLEVPAEARSDLDNRAKAALDLLRTHGLISDDRYVSTLLLRKNPDIEQGRARLRVWPE